MVDRRAFEKIVQSFEIDSESVDLIQTNRNLLIEDITVSKESEGKVKFNMTDGQNSVPIVFWNGPITDSVNPPHGWLYWKGANLHVETEGTCLVTVGYWIIDADDFEKWRLYKE